MHLVIYETTHHETISSMLELGDLYFDGITVFISNTEIISSESFLHFPSSNKINFVFKQNDESNRAFIKKMFQYIQTNKTSHLHISTFDNNRLYFMAYVLLYTNLKVSMSIQAVNEFCTLRFQNLKIITEAAAKLLAQKRIQHYRVFSNKMEEALMKKLPSAKISFIPASFFKAENVQKKVSDCFIIVVPGSIDANRRNYAEVFTILKYLQKTYDGVKKIKIVFAGTAFNQAGIDIKNQLETFTSASIEVITFSDYLSQAYYDDQLSAADVLWSPLQLNTIYKTVDEVYGTTTATGLTGDMMQHPKPTFLPFAFAVPAHYANAICLYNDVHDLVQQLIEFINKPSLLNEKVEKINDDFKFFETENFAKQFEAVVVQNL